MVKLCVFQAWVAIYTGQWIRHANFYTFFSTLPTKTAKGQAMSQRKTCQRSSHRLIVQSASHRDRLHIGVARILEGGGGRGNCNAKSYRCLSYIMSAGDVIATKPKGWGQLNAIHRDDTTISRRVSKRTSHATSYIITQTKLPWCANKNWMADTSSYQVVAFGPRKLHPTTFSWNELPSTGSAGSAQPVLFLGVPRSFRVALARACASLTNMNGRGCVDRACANAIASDWYLMAWQLKIYFLGPDLDCYSP